MSTPEPPLTSPCAIACKNCGHTETFPIHHNSRAVEGFLHLMINVKTVGKLNELFAGQRTQFCQCPPETELVYTPPAWFGNWLKMYKKDFDEWRKANPL